MRSIRRHLSVGLILSLVGVFIVLGVGVTLSFRMLTEGYILSRLEHDAESLLSALIVRPGDTAVELRAGRMNPIYQRPFSGHYYRIDVGAAVLRSRSLWDQTLEVPRVGVGENMTLRVVGPERQLLLVQVSGYRKEGRDFSIAVAEDLTPIKAEVRKFQLRYAGFGVLALLLLLMLQRHTLGRGLAPLGNMRREIAELENGERQQLSETVPHELLPVVRQVNRLLTVMQQRLARSRNAMGNLAHALKSPLTLLGQLADDDSAFSDPALAAQARELVERIRTLTDRELKRARLAGAGATGQRMALGMELEALADVLRSIYRDRALDIKLEVPAGLRFVADREDMHELFGNLLDNACKWARRKVRVRVIGSADQLKIQFEDDGPGRSADELQRLNQRGVRVDEAQVPGHGLGLAIAEDIVAHYGGELRLDRSPDLGGFLAEVRLPTGDPAAARAEV